MKLALKQERKMNVTANEFHNANTTLDIAAPRCVTLTRLITYGLTGVLMCAAPAFADVLTFSGMACTTSSLPADKVCDIGDRIAQDYGDTPGVNVQYSSADRFGTAATVTVPFLRWDDAVLDAYQFGDLSGVASISTERGGVTHINLFTLPGYRVRLNSFDLASDGASTLSTLHISDYNFNTLIDVADLNVKGGGTATHTHVDVGLTSPYTQVGTPAGFTIEWEVGVDGRLREERVVLDNLDFTIEALPASVPEPGSVLLLAAGLLGLFRRVKRT
jgi:PEP-CTERM motif